MRQYKMIFTSIMTLAFLAIFFQNCAEDFNPQSYGTDDLSSTGYPVITDAPLSVTATFLSPLEITVRTSGRDLQYTWFKDDVAIAGANTATFRVPSAQDSDAGTYRLDVSNDLGTVSVNIAVTISRLPVQTAPLLVTSVAPVIGRAIFNIRAGEFEGVRINGRNAEPYNQVTLSAIFASSVPMTYQWYKVNTTTNVAIPITAATESTLVFFAEGPSESGTYRVVATSAFGSTFSQNTVSITVYRYDPGSGPIP